MTENHKKNAENLTKIIAQTTFIFATGSVFFGGVNIQPASASTSCSVDGVRSVLGQPDIRIGFRATGNNPRGCESEITNSVYRWCNSFEIRGDGYCRADMSTFRSSGNDPLPPFTPLSKTNAYFNYEGTVRWYRTSASGFCGITSPTHLKVLQITDPAPSLGDRSPRGFGENLGICPPYAFYFNYGGAVRHFSSNRGGYCAFTSPEHLQRFQQSNPAISLENQTPRGDFGKDTGVCP
jgi:hypothetical protein